MSETGDSINVELAKALGYTVRHWKDFNGAEHWDLVNPIGDLAFIWDGVGIEYPARSEAEAWQHAPDFAHSVDATLATLPEHIAVDFRATRDGFPLGYYRVSLMDWTIHDGRQWKWDADGATRAEALARARLAMTKGNTAGMAKAQQERPDAT